MALLALGFASCDDKSDLGKMQENEQQAIMEANGLEVAYGTALQGATVDLNNYVDAAVPVITTVAATDLPEGATVEYVMQVASKADFSDAHRLQVSNGAVACSDWETAYVDMFGNSPEAETNYVRFEAYVSLVTTVGTQWSRLGGEDFFYGAKSLTVTPVNQNLPVESAYYLHGTGIDDVKMNHSNKHEWDDPVFTVIINVTAAQAADGFKWTIVPQSAAGTTDAAKMYGVSDTGDAAAPEGNLVLGGQAGEITTAGTYQIEVNMLELTYKVGTAYDVLYTPGPANGWSFTNNMLLYTDDYVNYKGFVYVDGEFKFAANASWDINWGIGEEEGTLAHGGKNIKVETNGLYYVTVDLGTGTYSLTLITSLGGIGGFNGWGSQTEMTPSADFKDWTGDITFSAGDEWKFRMNNNWDINLGGSYDNLDFGKGNLAAPGAGTYQVVLHLGKLPYSCTYTAK